MKKEICLRAGKAYERLLNKALRELDINFTEWRTGEIDPWELSDRIHKFHDGISRRLYVLAGDNHGQTILLEAIIQGEISLDELSLELREWAYPVDYTTPSRDRIALSSSNCNEADKPIA